MAKTISVENITPSGHRLAMLRNTKTGEIYVPFDPYDSLRSICWQLLRSFEEKVGKEAGALDALLIAQGYDIFNQDADIQNKPSYVKSYDELTKGMKR